MSSLYAVCLARLLKLDTLLYLLYYELLLLYIVILFKMNNWSLFQYTV